MDNRYPISGTVTEIGETKEFSAYFRKREFKIRITDTDGQNRIIERILKFSLINNDIKLIDDVVIDDIVKIQFYLDGKDYSKDGITSNYTGPVCYELDIITSPTRETKEDKKINMIQGGTAPLKQSTLDELMVTPTLEKEEEKDEFAIPDINDEFKDLPF